MDKPKYKARSLVWYKRKVSVIALAYPDQDNPGEWIYDIFDGINYGKIYRGIYQGDIKPYKKPFQTKEQ